MLFAKLLDDEDQIESVDNPITVGVGSRFTEVVGNLQQIQDIDPPIAVDIGRVWDFEIDFAIEVGEEMSFCLNQMSIES